MGAYTTTGCCRHEHYPAAPPTLPSYALPQMEANGSIYYHQLLQALTAKAAKINIKELGDALKAALAEEVRWVGRWQSAHWWGERGVVGRGGGVGALVVEGGELARKGVVGGGRCVYLCPTLPTVC